MTTISKKMMKTFFEEKNLPCQTFEITSDDGTWNLLNTDVVIEYIMSMTGASFQQAAHMILNIDLKNGNVNHFLKYVGKFMVNN